MGLDRLRSGWKRRGGDLDDEKIGGLRGDAKAAERFSYLYRLVSFDRRTDEEYLRYC